MNLMQKFEALGRKQLALQEGIQLLQDAQFDLRKARGAADAWGITAVMANVTLVPLNCIVNAFELKAANSAYQVMVHALYKKFAKSGTRVEGPAKDALSTIKTVAVDELKRRAQTDLIPGVNILIGLAEDSLAALQTVQKVEAGKHDMNDIAAGLERKIAAATAQLTALGIERAQVYDRLDAISRTA